MIMDSLEYTLHVITIQFGVLCVTSEEFNLEAANVNSNIYFTISGSAIFPELVTVTFIGISSSNFFTRGYS